MNNDHRKVVASAPISLLDCMNPNNGEICMIKFSKYRKMRRLEEIETAKEEVDEETASQPGPHTNDSHHHHEEEADVTCNKVVTEETVTLHPDDIDLIITSMSLDLRHKLLATLVTFQEKFATVALAATNNRYNETNPFWKTYHQNQVLIQEQKLEIEKLEAPWFDSILGKKQKAEHEIMHCRCPLRQLFASLSSSHSSVSFAMIPLELGDDRSNKEDKEDL
jgi:hypothetical protein